MSPFDLSGERILVTGAAQGIGAATATLCAPLGRTARAGEIAGPIAFLCSGAASYICGAVLDVNGGVPMA